MALSEIELHIADSIRKNSEGFLRRAAAEIVGHDDSKDAAFSPETGTIVAMLTQIAFELALASFLVRNNGIRSILEKPALTDREIEESWYSNSLRTNRFEDNKRFFIKQHSLLYEPLEGLIESFQGFRNKIAHFHCYFHEADLYDLKFESSTMLIHAISRLLFETETDHSQNVADVFSRPIFEKLIKFKPYLLGVTHFAELHSDLVMHCPACGQHAFSDLELRCFACMYEEQTLNFLRCDKCTKLAVAYDRHNLPYNESMRTLCLNCGHKARVFQCKSCKSVSVYDEAPICEFCDE